jgi:hypothetical protein
MDSEREEERILGVETMYEKRILQEQQYCDNI